MREYPVFVPSGDEHLAAVVTMPLGQPQALILLIQGGGGAPRSYFDGTWTRIARALTEHGFASVRMDWLGVGDSTGVFAMRLAHPPASELRSVLKAAIGAVGTDRLGIAAECGGAAAVLALAEEIAPQCESVVVIKPALASRVPRLLGRRSGALRQKVGEFLRGHARLNRMARRAYWRIRTPSGAPEVRSLANLRRSAPVLVLGYQATVKYRAAMRAAARRHHLGSFQIEEVPFEGPLGLRDSIGRAAFLEQRIVSWFAETLGYDPDGHGAATAHLD